MRQSNLAVCWTKALAAVVSSLGLSWVVAEAATPIQTFFTAVTPPQAVHNSRSIRFEFTSNFADARFICSLNDDDPTFCTSPKIFQQLRDGDYRFRVYAQSPTGGTDAIGTTHTWRVDTLPPSTWLAATPLAQDTLEFELAANEANCTYLCSFDGSVAQPCATPYRISAISAGRHLFRAWARDEAGNIDPVGAEYSFEVTDLVSIQTRITAVNPTDTYSATTSKRIEFTSNQAQGSFVCSLNGAPFSACASPWEVSQLLDGPHRFQVKGLSVHGQVDPVGDFHEWSVDTVPAVGLNVQAQVSSTSITVTWSTNEPATTRLSWGLNGILTREVADDDILKTQHSVRLTGLSSNTVYTIEPAGHDRAGNPHKLARFNARTLR